jgi:hypothetical protein
MNDIDFLFGVGYPLDKRYDNDQNAPLLNIVYAGGSCGTFLKYFLDKFSSLSPDLKETPFTDVGTAEKKIKYSNLIQRYHPQFINDNKDFIDLPVCLILPETEKSYFYLKFSQWYRADHLKVLPDELWSKKIKDHHCVLKLSQENIFSFYKITDCDQIPKFIVRDWYKLGFLEEDKSKNKHNLWFEMLKNHPYFKKQKTHHFPLESFFDFEIFIKNIKILNSIFNINLDFTRMLEMKNIFNEAYQLDQFRQEVAAVFNIIDILSAKHDMDITELSVVSEAFLYSYIEKTVPFIQMPLSNHFFKNTKEIKDYIGFYPEHYKAMNPNMSKFNGIDNPFYLYKNKK